VIRAACLASVLAVAQPAAAGGFSISEIGVGRSGMASVVGNPDEPSAAAHNPAGLTRLAGTHVYASFGIAMIDTAFRLAAWEGSDAFLGPPESDGYYATVRPDRALAAIPMLAGTFQLTDRWFAGVALYVTNATGSAFSDTAVTRYHAISGSLIAPVGMLSVAGQVHPKLAVGASVGAVNVRLSGRRQIYPVRDGMDVSSILGTDAELEASGSDTALAWNAGVLATPVPRLGIGLAVIGRIDATVAGPATLSYGPPGAEDELIGRHETGLLLPWVLQAGANLGVTRSLDVGTEARYWLYHQLREQRSDVAGLLFVREVVVEKDFHDSYQLAGGVRAHDLAFAPGLELMAGLHYDRSPAPTRTVSLDQPTFDNIGIHTGLRWTHGAYRFGLSYLYLGYLVPTVTNSVTDPPSNFTGGGHTHLITASIEAVLRNAPLWR
jgi:long-subunit fatty acid transport protein